MPLVLDFNRLPYFSKDTVLHFQVKMEPASEHIGDKKKEGSIKVKGMAKMPEDVAPTEVECQLHYGHELKGWKEVKDGVLHNSFFKQYQDLKNIRIEYKSPQALQELGVTDIENFLQIELEPNGQHSDSDPARGRRIDHYKVNDTVLGYSLWVHIEQLKGYKGSEERIALPFAIIYELSDDIHPVKHSFVLLFFLHQAKAKITYKYEAIREEIDLSQDIEEPIEIGTLKISNETRVAFSESYHAHFHFLLDDKSLKDAFKFENGRHEYSKTLTAEKHQARQKIVLDAEAFPPYRTNKEITFVLEDKKLW